MVRLGRFFPTGEEVIVEQRAPVELKADEACVVLKSDGQSMEQVVRRGDLRDGQNKVWQFFRTVIMLQGFFQKENFGSDRHDHVAMLRVRHDVVICPSSLCRARWEHF